MHTDPKPFKKLSWLSQMPRGEVGSETTAADGSGAPKPFRPKARGKFLNLYRQTALREFVSETKGKELKENLLDYMKKAKVTTSMLREYISYYPERIYKNLYETGLLDYVSA